MGDVIWPAEFGAHQLAVPVSKYMKSSYWSAFARGLIERAQDLAAAGERRRRASDKDLVKYGLVWQGASYEGG